MVTNMHTTVCQFAKKFCFSWENWYLVQQKCKKDHVEVINPAFGFEKSNRSKCSRSVIVNEAGKLTSVDIASV